MLSLIDGDKEGDKLGLNDSLGLSEGEKLDEMLGLSEGLKLGDKL